MKGARIQLGAALLLVTATTLVCWQIFGRPASGPDGSVTGPPPKVNQPARVKESLKPGKVYQTHAEGTVNFRGRDKAWGIETVVSINYAFESDVDREVVSNDGTKVVEIRRFRDVRSLKVESTLEDLRIDLGDNGGLLLGALAALNRPSAGILYVLDKQSLKPLIAGLRWSGVRPEELAGLDEKAKAFTMLDRLTGKSCRLTYVDGEGVVQIDDLDGQLDADERAMLRATVVASDTLIFPNEQVAKDASWTVSGRALGGMIDPSLRATTNGEFTLRRGSDRIVDGKNCAHLEITGGRILFDSSSRAEGRIGHFEPIGWLDFSLDDKAVIRGEAHGIASFERFSKDHLLFETRSSQNPMLHLKYRCTVIDPPKGN